MFSKVFFIYLLCLLERKIISYGSDDFDHFSFMTSILKLKWWVLWPSFKRVTLYLPKSFHHENLKSWCYCPWIWIIFTVLWCGYSILATIIWATGKIRPRVSTDMCRSESKVSTEWCTDFFFFSWGWFMQAVQNWQTGLRYPGVQCKCNHLD